MRVLIGVPVSIVALASALSGLAPAQPASTGDYPYQPVPFTKVQFTGGFWGPRFETNRDVTLWYNFKKCEETGRIANFARAAGREKGDHVGIRFDDSDVFKVIEGAAYTLAQHPDPKLDAYLDRLIELIAAAQEKDGYLFTIRTLGRQDEAIGKERWSYLASSHELYNVGHLYEAAVAHYEATGKRSLLDVALRNAELIDQVFGPGPDQRKDTSGHEEIELGLVKLYRATGERRYLDLAKFFIDMRGRADLRGSVYGDYAQDAEPLVEQTEAVGHAVRGGYLYSAVADVAALTNDPAYIQAIDRIWQDVVARKLYLTGSVGQHGAGEGYAGPYKLSNIQAYNETCASIALALWNQRMFLLHGDSKYVDALERTLYNGFLSGVSLSGDQFFYPNPLECDMSFRFNQGSLQRKPWFDCSCCPSNIVRFMPSIAGFQYAVRDANLYANLYQASTAVVTVGGKPVRLVQETDYPWQGTVRIAVEPDAALEFALHLRIPAWLRGQVLPSDLYHYANPEPADWSVSVNGQVLDRPELGGGYAVLTRTWQPGDLVELKLPMPVRRVLANDQITADRGRVAIERGPLVYCAEGADQRDAGVLDRYLPDEATFEVTHEPGLLGGVTVLDTTAKRLSRGTDGAVVDESVPMRLIPYYAWCHRGANEMAVWLPRTAEGARVPPVPTIASTSKVTASFCSSLDTLDAVNDQELPENSNDHEVARMTWWSHLGTPEWIAYEFPEPRKVSSIGVYWFDDTGRGACRVPASCRVLYRDGDQWKPVAPKASCGVAPDRMNTLSFDPVETDAVRLDVQLKPGDSAGVLEWQVEPAP